MAIFPGAEGPRLVARLVSDVAEGLRVLVTRDGVALTEEQIMERARGIVTNFVVNYDVRPIPESGTRPAGHGWSCKCEGCAP